MKKILAIAILTCAPFVVAQAQAPDKGSPPQKAMDSATPEMKNPAGSKDLHPPQKAMDEATPTKDSSSGASAGDTGSSKTWNAKEASDAANKAGNKEKVNVGGKDMQKN